MSREPDPIEGLAEAVRTRSAVLFVGGGVSMNLGLPSWDLLVQKMAEDLGHDPQEFATLGDYLSLAEYYKLEHGSLDPLVRWMAKTWHDPGIRIGESQIHRLIVELGFPRIYTTNFDRWLEESFEFHGRPYVKIVKVRDFLDLNGDATQIVKLHGDLEEPESLVLDEESYFQRLDFESPLDIKLRADVIHRTVLFVGYSLRDVNIRYLLYKLHRLWEDSDDSEARPASYIYLAQRNPAQELVLQHRGIVTITCEDEDPGLGLQRFLESVAARAGLGEGPGPAAACHVG